MSPLTKFLLTTFTIILIAAFWQLLTWLRWIPIELSSPVDVINFLFSALASGQLLTDWTASLQRIGLGLPIGSATGIVLGLITGRSALVNQIAGPFIHFMRSLPPVALLTLFVALLGSSEAMRIWSVAFTSLFGVYVNTHTGAASVPIEYIRSSQLLSPNPVKRLLKVVLPASLPYVFTGIRLSMSAAFIVTYVGETAGTSSGIGYQIVDAQNTFQYAKMIGYLIVLGGTAATADWLIRRFAVCLFPYLPAI